ncbi:MAG: DHH family phosphoesterase [Candidatus Thermoplasmatota archaeon]|nr:DHH family phosphoesterase [Candidatus Thermoplasmatota archaeon]
MYVILGCGSVGFKVASTLKERGEEVFVVDAGEARVQNLRDGNLNAAVGDLRNLEPFKDTLAKADALLLLSSDVEANQEGILYIREQFPGARIIARAVDPPSRDALKKAGADEVILPQEVLARSVERRLRDVEMESRVRSLKRLVTNARSLGIFLQSNPDPDAISSAMALEYIAKSINPDLEVHKLAKGQVGRPENRAMINLLSVELEQVADSEEARDVVSSVDLTALVDVSVAGKNNPLPEEVVPNIVFDHHPTDDDRIKADFRDVRPGVGATATLLTGYLRELGLTPPKDVATALMYGIRTDTKELTSKVDMEDLEAVRYLGALMDSDMLRRIESPPMSSEQAAVLGRAIDGMNKRGSLVVSFLGVVPTPDFLSYVADFLLDIEGVDTVVVYGLVQGTIHVSSRSRDVRVHLGNVMEDLFGPNRGGGHAHMAGAQIPVDVFVEIQDRREFLDSVETALSNKFLRALGHSVPDDRDRGKRDEEA